MGILEEMMAGIDEQESVIDGDLSLLLGEIKTETSQAIQQQRSNFSIGAAGYARLNRIAGANSSVFNNLAKAANNRGRDFIENDLTNQGIAEQRKALENRQQGRRDALRRKDRARALRRDGVSSLMDNFTLIPQDSALRDEPTITVTGPDGSIIEQTGGQGQKKLSKQEERGVRAQEIAAWADLPAEAILERLEEEDVNPLVIENKAVRDSLARRKRADAAESATRAARMAADPTLRTILEPTELETATADLMIERQSEVLAARGNAKAQAKLQKEFEAQLKATGIALPTDPVELKAVVQKNIAEFANLKSAAQKGAAKAGQLLGLSPREDLKADKVARQTTEENIESGQFGAGVNPESQKLLDTLTSAAGSSPSGILGAAVGGAPTEAAASIPADPAAEGLQNITVAANALQRSGKLAGPVAFRLRLAINTGDRRVIREALDKASATVDEEGDIFERLGSDPSEGSASAAFISRGQRDQRRQRANFGALGAFFGG